MGLTGRHKQQRKVHGAHGLTDAQMRVFRTWSNYLDRHLHHPTQVELANQSGTSVSQISMWMNQWEQQGLVKMGKGFRQFRMTPACVKMLLEIESLDRLWREYVTKREQFIRDYSFTNTGEAPNLGVQRENSRYEERDSSQYP